MGEDVAQRPPGGGAQRLDKWLWYARVVKTRSLAAALVTRGRVRVNRERIQKPSQTVKPGDVITASVSRDMRVLKVLLPGTRRGPASEAQTLYEDLSPVKIAGPSAGGAVSGDQSNTSGPPVGGVFDTGSGRPSKKERRQIVRLKGQDR
ncbi:MAG: RNA-binding S4 domain-containing protein [Alphaproteobacteria bacterium]|nr:RNA-binding S4 domain-containing protein [Alphaproteobacteria bacterium]